MSMVEPFLPWAEDAAEQSLLDRQLGQIFAAVPEATPLSEAARQRVARNLRRRPTRRTGLLLLRLVLVGTLIGVAGAAAAQWAVQRFFMPQRELILPRTGGIKPAGPAPVLRAASPAVVAANPELPAPPRPAAEAPERPPSASAAPAPVASQSSRLGLEAASLEVALSALRSGGKQSAARALVGIDQHLRAFPGGSLELEARVARVDALLVLGKRHEARHELEKLPLERAGRRAELRLIRAELLADDDCRAALVDFEQLALQPLPAAWAERALFGRGACLLRLGRRAAAERDFATYLERYPEGRFAAQVQGQQNQAEAAKPGPQ